MNYKIYPFKREKKYRFYVRFEDENGNQKNFSTGVTFPLKYTNRQRMQARKKAEEVAKRRILRYFNREKELEKSKIDRLSTYLERYYYPHLQTNRSEQTLKTYQRAFDHLLENSGDHPLPYYDKSHIHDYKIYRCHKHGVRKTTVNIELRSIKAGFYWAFKNDYTERFALKGQEYLFNVSSTKREFKKHELDRLFRITEGKMIGLAIQLAYHTGMRQGELSRTTWHMVNMDEKCIHLPASITKSNKTRKIPLNRKAFNIINVLRHVLKNKRKRHPEWYKDAPFNECYLLQKDRGFGRYQARSLQDMFRKYMNEAGLPKELTFHCLRHTFATQALAKGADIFHVSKIMGHSTPMVTAQFYDHTSTLQFRAVTDLLCAE